MSIIITKRIERESNHRVMTVPADITPELTFPDMTDATPDDLRAACEAVPLVDRRAKSHEVPTSDVAATLAAMLGEVGA